MPYILFLLLVLFSNLSARELSPFYVYPLDNNFSKISYWNGGDITDSNIDIANICDSTKENIVEGFGVWGYYFGMRTGVRLYCRDIMVAEKINSYDNLVITVPAAISAYKLYWDGELIGGSGVLGNSKDTEVMGKTSQIFSIPHDRSLAGLHNLVFILSNYSVFSGTIDEPIGIGALSVVTTNKFKEHILGIFLAGIFFITSIFHIFLFSRRDKIMPHILFSVFSLSCAAHIIISNFPLIFPIDLAIYLKLAIIGDLFWLGLLASLPLFLLSYFDMPFKKSGAIAVILITFIVVLLPRLSSYGIIPITYLDTLEFINRTYAFLSIFIALGINVKALHQKKEGSRTILIGLVAFLVGVSLTTVYGYFNGWLLGLAALNIFITIAIAHQINDQRKLFHKSELKTTRLELELLKKHIQPHFLLNSLNSIMAWVEEEPEVATKLITELSQELRLLMSFAGERKIALSQEIKLCRVHLGVMSLRQEKDFKLTVTGSIEGVNIPPLILHTIVENGISHGFRKRESGEFYLDCSNNGEFETVITLENNGENSSNKTVLGGTGNLYVKSRLGEVYGKNWSYDSVATDTGWKSEIRFRRDS